jgi:phosphoribosyl 1,2-cyclic phosphodiesterase
MPVFIASINSGSNSNCYYVGTPHHAVLVDTGLSCRETERRMKQLQLDMDKVRAIFISHEHADHITGLAGLSKKYQLPVYITNDTFRASRLPVQDHLLRHFRHKDKITVGDLQILPFKKFHDADDPHSFVISAYGRNVGVLTDIGHACREVIHYFSQCDAVFLESNYCDDMLANGNYPYYLKKRISSDVGHLSNAQALELFCRHRHEALELLILSHLSKNNNHPDVVERLFKPHAGNTQLFVASRYAASPVFELGERYGKEVEMVREVEVKVEVRKKVLKKLKNENQLSLF